MQSSICSHNNDADSERHMFELGEIEITNKTNSLDRSDHPKSTNIPTVPQHPTALKWTIQLSCPWYRRS